MIFSVVCLSSPLFSQWTVQHSGLPDSQNPTLLLSAVDSNVCWGAQGDSYNLIANMKCILTTDGGVNWKPMDIQGLAGLQAASVAGLNATTAWIAVFDPTSITSGGIFKTTDGGLTWTKQTSAFPGAGGHPMQIYFFDANNGLCTGQPRNGYWEIYTTSDGGTNWTRVPSAHIPAMASGDFGGHGTGAGNCFWFNSASCSVYRTTDRGLTWSVSRNIFPQPAFFLELAFKDTLNGMASSYYGDDINKISKSTDGGVTWTRLPAPPTPPSAGGIIYIPGTIGTYMIACQKNIGYPEPTRSGSIYTPDDGVTWIPVDNLAHGWNSFVSNKTGWSAGCGDTIFKWKSEFPLGIGDVKPSNSNVTLDQNYPNPFSSSTAIGFRIQESSNVILKVYDALGTEVATLVNGEKSAGSYVVKFEPHGLRTGIYYYRLQAGESVQTKILCIL
ncbi:MAG: T9SS type A sorting domain-containing protein [Bacteroidetes bacterium]|nr:T9SS type A sorting domain-containing protein [Bacteroidota bacterium]